MDWIHCNTCSLQPGDQKERHFALTSCGHIYCDLCVVVSTKEKCRVCGSQCNSVQLTAQMRPDVQHFFTEPEDVLKKALKIMEFQKGHRQRLTSYRRTMVTREQAAIEEIKKLRNRVQELEGQVTQLKNIVNCYEKRRPSSGEVTHMQHNKTPSTVKSPSWSMNQSQPRTPSQGASSQSRMPASQQFGPSQCSTPQLQNRSISQVQQRPSHPMSSPAQQQGVSPAKSDCWVTPNRLTLRKTSPSQLSQSAVSPLSPAAHARIAGWNASPGMRPASQVASPLAKRPPSRISPYLPMRNTSASQGTMTMSPKDRFPYLASQPGRK